MAQETNIKWLVTLNSTTKNGWSKIKFKNKQGYVSSEFLRVYSSFSSSTAKKITEKVYNIQFQAWEGFVTKKQYETIMSKGYTKKYIEAHFHQNMLPYGTDKYGNQLYTVLETSIWGTSVELFDWNLEYNPKKPKVTYYQKNGKDYLSVSQYVLNEMDGYYTYTLYLSKDSKSSTWKVYNINRKYD
ncbi:hypothetical protein SM124_19645 [Bacillus sp. 31A1R]|uniref:SH3 domain-containing protein n=1 Tax=Robertmurraya mangrovi TaxID=3098077 RepID=A0ABU5J3C9_9BACI|nr:hypothetical protein [Bacillus sp. 31A1R]MDZ5473938.1 hypothetical protein [Bacillus sp. 31A1R]